MYTCDCGRDFNTPQGLGYHKKFCGKNKISYDNGYACRINEEGELVYIHREILEQKLGRKLKPGEIAHHIDENKLNNDPSNVELKNRSNHAKIHVDEFKPKKYPRGIQIGSCKLTENDVRNIKTIFKFNPEKNVCAVARNYNLHESTIRNIRDNNSWKHIII